MNTTAAIFFLILGQAPDGFHATGSSMAVIPHEYPSLAACEASGEEARINNQGLAFLSYTCVFAERTPTRVQDGNSLTPTSVQLGARVAKVPVLNGGVK